MSTSEAAGDMDPRLVRWLLRKCARSGARATIQYLNTLRLVEPLHVDREMLAAMDQGRARQFRVEFIRQVVPLDDADQTPARGRPRELEDARRFELYIPRAWVAEIDIARRGAGESRAAWMRAAIATRLGHTPLTEGDI